MSNNNNPKAVITGASSGIGLALAKEFAKHNYNLILAAKDRDLLLQAAETLRLESTVDIQIVAQDLSTYEGVQALYEAASSDGPVEVLCANAGFGEYGDFSTETDLDKELNMIDLNVKSLVHITKLISRDMAARGKGRILLTASVVSFVPDPTQAVYAGTKAFVYNFAQGIRESLKSKGVTVTALMPGATDTNFFFRAGAMQSKVVQEGKLADPADVAEVAYKALMDGDDHVVHGLKNKAMVQFAELAPSPLIAKMTAKQMEPVRKKTG